VLVGFVIYYLVRGRVDLDWELVFFPLGILLQFLLLVGLGLILAPLTVLATDMQRVVRILLRFMFYLSPVLYGTHAVPEVLRVVLAFNPLNGILSLYRGGLFARGVSWFDVGISTAITGVLLVLGFWLFARLERTVLKEI
jgi:ABC-2 type transport system permease protein